MEESDKPLTSGIDDDQTKDKSLEWQTLVPGNGRSQETPKGTFLGAEDEFGRAIALAFVPNKFFQIFERAGFAQIMLFYLSIQRLTTRIF